MLQVVQTLKSLSSEAFPALHDLVEFVGKFVRGIIPEPQGLDHAAALRRRRLLVLAGKIVFADRAAQLCQHLSRLALGVQRFARFAAKDLPSEHGLDPVPFVRLGNRRQTHDVPVLLPQHVTGEVVLVQSVHDQHDRTRKLVVEPAIEGVVVPLVGRLALRLRQRLVGLQQVVDDDDDVGASRSARPRPRW